jgi:hypothetical protein
MPAAFGQQVLYRLTVSDVHEIEMQRAAVEHYVGSPVEPGQTCQALITMVVGQDVVNLQVFLDGNDPLWATEVPKGNGQGEWRRAY